MPKYIVESEPQIYWREEVEAEDPEAARAFALEKSREYLRDATEHVPIVVRVWDADGNEYHGSRISSDARQGAQPVAEDGPGPKLGSRPRTVRRRKVAGR